MVWATNPRREADKDPLKKQLGDVIKVKGNGFYGKMIEDLDWDETGIWDSQEKLACIATDKFTERTPGLFKPEFVGTRVWCVGYCEVLPCSTWGRGK